MTRAEKSETEKRETIFLGYLRGEKTLLPFEILPTAPTAKVVFPPILL